MNLTYRRATKENFAGAYCALFPQHQSDYGLREIVPAEWNVILANPATLCMVVEDTDRPAGARIVGCAQTVFVSDAFVRMAKSGDTPYPIQRLGEPLLDNTRPMLSLEQVRAANSGDGLNAFTTRWGWDESLPNVEDRRRVREFLDQKYPLFYQGYNFKELLIQATGDWPCKGLELAGYKVRADYAACYKGQSEQPTGEQHPYLLGLTRQEAHQHEGSSASKVFAYMRPCFGLRDIEQETLCRALDGFTDPEIAAQLCVSVDAVKACWKTIYDCVSAAMPTLLPVNSETGRGPEKRRLLLCYLRNHLEELRPVVPRR